MFKLVYAKSIKKDIKNLDTKTKEKLKNEIEKLQHFPNLSQIKRLKSYPFADFRLKVGNYRVLFDVDFENQELHILKIAHRKDLY
ncbi:type II toxin-antitoxin system RelE family toxin [Nautilia sp.]